jgi:hypothetical protein
MAEIKTKKNAASVDEFIDSIEDEKKRADARTLVALMQEVTGDAPAMWGTAIVGFGHRVYKYANGRDVDWMEVGFAPRKANFSLYIMGAREPLDPLLARLGKHKTDGGCLYIKRLSDIDLTVLREIVETSIASQKE